MTIQTPTDALRLVPVDPTEAMLNAAIEGFPRSHPSVFPIIYRYMIDAAPASPLPEGGGDMDWQSIAMWMGFSASVIKSGEPWTDQCQQHYDEAKAAFARLSAPTGAK